MSAGAGAHEGWLRRVKLTEVAGRSRAGHRAPKPRRFAQPAAPVRLSPSGWNHRNHRVHHEKLPFLGSLLMMVSAPKNLEVKAKRLAAASHWLATRPRLPPSSTSPSPLSRQGRAQKSRLRRVSQSRMLAIPGATQWRHRARNRTTPIGKNFGGSRRLCTSVGCRQAFTMLSAWICKD